MAEFPSMPLWTDAYLADTSHLTTIEHGAYLLLLMIAWRTQEKRLPDDDKLLARYARMTPSQWKRMRPTLAGFFKIENGYWTQGRLIDEANAVKRYRERQSAAGKASALKRNGRHSTTVELGCNRSPTPSPSPISNKEEPKGSPPKAPRKRWVSKPDCVPDELWSDWRAYRKSTFTDSALKGFLREVNAAGWSLEDGLAESMLRGWQGFKAEWVKDKRNGRQGNETGGSDKRDGVAKALDRRIGLEPDAGEVGRRTVRDGERDRANTVASIAFLR